MTTAEREITLEVDSIYRTVDKSAQRPRPSISAAKHHYLTQGHFAGRFWDPCVTPYMADMLDASMYYSVRRVSVCKSPQTGISTMLDTLRGYTIAGILIND